MAFVTMSLEHRRTTANRTGTGANASGRANLRGANLRGVKLQRVILYGAILLGANLGKTKLVKAKIKKADIEKAKIEKADIPIARFKTRKQLDLVVSPDISSDDLSRLLSALDTIHRYLGKIPLNIEMIKIGVPEEQWTPTHSWENE